MSNEDSNNTHLAKIEIGTTLQRALESGTDKEKVDAIACLIAGQPQVVSRIAGYCVPELRDLTLDETMRQIAGAIHIGVDPGQLYLTSATVADKRVGRGSVFFDVVVTIQLPDSARRARVIINIEPQNSIPSWEWITGRIDLYQADLIMSQLGHEVIHRNYDGLIDVYSVWLFLSPDADYAQNHVQYEEPGERWQDLQAYAKSALQDTFRKARAQSDKNVDFDRLLEESIKNVEDAIHPQDPRNKETRFRRHHPPNSRMHTVKVFLGKPEKASDPLEKFVDILFDQDMAPDQKGDLLESEFKIPKTIILMEDLRNMGAYSEAIIEATKRKLTKEYDKKIADLNKDHDKKIADLNKDHVKKMADLNDLNKDHEKKITELNKAVIDADQRAADAARSLLQKFAMKYLRDGMTAEETLVELMDIARQNVLSQEDVEQIVSNAYEQFRQKR